MHVVNYLRRRGEANFEEISNLLERESHEQGFKFTISQRTLQRDIKEIYTLYGITIECNKKTGKYYIAEEEETHSNSRMLETFDLYNALKFSSFYLPLIQFERRVARGNEHVFVLLHAIKNRLLVKFIYSKFYTQESEIRTVEPLLLKEFNGRWYLVSRKAGEDTIRTFGLDRITEIETLRQKLPAGKSFNAENYFRDAFGIFVPVNEPAERVVLSFSKEQGQYVKSYPLHPSQQIVKESDSEIQIELKVYLSYDFLHELLSYGENITVISPKKLINQIKKVHTAVANKYI
jgi:predicted DNA-binding transcriptional regulator YafY